MRKDHDHKVEKKLGDIDPQILRSLRNQAMLSLSAKTGLSEKDPKPKLATPEVVTKTGSKEDKVGQHNDKNGVERIYTSLLREGKSLGFSITGGKGAEQFVEDSEAVFISKIAEEGPAAKDGRLQVGDKLVQINGVDVSEADHSKVVELLTGLERFVNITVERKMTGIAPSGSNHNSVSSTNLFSQPSLSSLSAIGATPGSANDTKSPKVFGLPKPYTGLYSASSYMANRPSYMRTREPGQYTITTSASSSPGSVTSTPSYSKLPGVNAPPPGGSSATLPGSRTLPDIPRTTSVVAARSLPRKAEHPSSTEVANNDDSAVRQLMERLPPVPTKAGVSTETVTKTTFSETTVRRVTDNRIVPLVVEVSTVWSWKNICSFVFDDRLVFNLQYLPAISECHSRKVWRSHGPQHHRWLRSLLRALWNRRSWDIHIQGMSR